MPESALAKKMKRKPEARVAILQAPAGYEAAAFAGMPRAVGSLTGTFDWIQMFVRNEAELTKLVPGAARALKPNGMLWISFPKGSSKIQTDLTRDRGWDSLEKLDLRRMTLISVDATWSAFAFRPNKGVQKRTPGRS